MTSKYGQLGSDDFRSTPLAEQSRTSEAEPGPHIPLHCLPGILEQGMLLAVEGLLTWRSSGKFRGGLKAGMTNCVRAVALYRKCCRAVSPQEPPSGAAREPVQAQPAFPWPLQDSGYHLPVNSASSDHKMQSTAAGPEMKTLNGTALIEGIALSCRPKGAIRSTQSA